MPFPSRASMSAPFSRRFVLTSVCPLEAARCIGVSSVTIGLNIGSKLTKTAKINVQIGTSCIWCLVQRSPPFIFTSLDAGSLLSVRSKLHHTELNWDPEMRAYRRCTRTCFCPIIAGLMLAPFDERETKFVTSFTNSHVQRRPAQLFVSLNVGPAFHE